MYLKIKKYIYIYMTITLVKLYIACASPKRQEIKKVFPKYNYNGFLDDFHAL